MTDDRLGTAALKTVIADLSVQIAQVEREQSLLSMRVYLICSKLETVARALDSWYDVLSREEPERTAIDINK